MAVTLDDRPANAAHLLDRRTCVDHPITPPIITLTALVSNVNRLWKDEPEPQQS